MKIQMFHPTLLFLCFIIPLITSVHAKLNCSSERRFKRKVQGKGFGLENEFVLNNASVSSMEECLFQCFKEKCCASITYREDTSSELFNCQTNNVLSLNYSGPLIQDDEPVYYYELVNAHETLNLCCFITCENGGHCDEKTEQCSCKPGFSGSSCSDIYIGSVKSFPAGSCLEIKTKFKDSKSGVYWIQLNISDIPTEPFQVYCDMDTHGGGWTLVYAYTFTNYDDFFAMSNAVTPRPSWSASYADVDISTLAPNNESALGAMDYNFWEYIGEEFLIKSNINDWIVCQSNGGSIVREQNGKILCENIKNVATTCSGTQPKSISWGGCGPRIYADTTFYRFDGATDNCYPTHDPCNAGETKNHKRNVLNPGGKIFLR